MDTMNSEKKIEEKINSMLNRRKNAGFTEPPADYFEQFANSLSLEKKETSMNYIFSTIKENWMQIGSFAVAAILLLAVWLFVYDANIKNDADANFTVEELMALNDFQNFNEDLIYSELALVSDAGIIANDAEVDVLLNFDYISSEEIIELYSTEDIK